MKSSVRITNGGNTIRFTGRAARAAFVAISGAKLPMKFLSVARWPAGEVSLGDPRNESRDTHDTREQAQAICDRLRREGFGGDGKIFPLETRVEEIPG